MCRHVGYAQACTENMDLKSLPLSNKFRSIKIAFRAVEQYTYTQFCFLFGFFSLSIARSPFCLLVVFSVHLRNKNVHRKLFVLSSPSSSSPNEVKSEGYCYLCYCCCRYMAYTHLQWNTEERFAILLLGFWNKVSIRFLTFQVFASGLLGKISPKFLDFLSSFEAALCTLRC